MTEIRDVPHEPLEPGDRVVTQRWEWARSISHGRWLPLGLASSGYGWSALRHMFPDAEYVPAPRPPQVGRVIPSRRTDPPTSHTAAGQVVVRAGTQRARLLSAFGGPMPILSGGSEADGLTDYEAAVLAFGVDLRSEYAKRCSELRDAGLIEVVDAADGSVLTRRSHAGGPARMVCRITPEGSKVLTEIRTRPSTTATHTRSNDA